VKDLKLYDIGKMSFYLMQKWWFLCDF